MSSGSEVNNYLRLSGLREELTRFVLSFGAACPSTELSFDGLSFDELSLVELSLTNYWKSSLYRRSLSTSRSDFDLSSFFESLPIPLGRWGMGFIGVIGDVPARAFELHGWRGDHLLDLAAAFRALLDHLVGKFLDFLEAVAAFFALVFVKRHGFLRRLSNTAVQIRF